MLSTSLIHFLRSRARSFQHAFAGWWFVIRTQQNAWIHAVASVTVVGLGLWLHLDLQDWAVVLLTIALVWTAEFLNTALEAIATLAADGREHPLAKVGKDVGAAAVLIAAAASVAIGLLILGPPLLERLGF
ncbi:MAG: diacylglycerol kinase family protein [Anaerolineales bacterium]|nr:diacylglycerol kinase family protein [Anaerolineales bacterium]MCS7248661.1 diacylglycerol kinase family protein [Anaerolineales bacterium]MDW8162474.1 diacylglycerol kinase family protein [Anaerolineales bacterium]MDW8447909.1 diacylglycerol kinase family protein [Anaerolineales bacterium]